MKKIKSFKDLHFLKDEFENLNKREKKKKVTLFNNDYFTELTINDKSSGFKSVFTDEQVIKLIYKISNRNIRKLIWEFERIQNKECDRYLHLKFILHTICNKLLKLYGSKMISFIIDMNVKHRTSEIVGFHSNIYSINLEKESLDFDTIEIKKEVKINTIFGEMSYYERKHIGFEISEYNKKPYMIVCDSKGALEGRINELGYIEDEFISRMKFNIFQFMEEGDLYYYGAILNCYCSICQRELTVPESVFYGMGPICRADYYIS